MPTEYNDDNILQKNVDVCSELSPICTDYNSQHVMIIGDLTVNLTPILQCWEIVENNVALGCV